nr:MAG TPA: hypothetical protein [Inoviridae sp.]
MGYRVGGQCFATSEKASDYQMSMVVPTITADGSLKTAVYQNGKWYYGSQEVKLSFPKCDPAEPFKEGLQTGSLILGIFIAVFAVKAIIKLFEHLKEKEQ